MFERVEFNKGVLIYKTVKGYCPSYLSDMFTYQTSNAYKLRSCSNNDMCIPSHNNELFKKTLQYSVVQLWNNLPVHLRTTSTLSTFKHSLTKHIISKR